MKHAFVVFLAVSVLALSSQAQTYPYTPFGDAVLQGYYNNLSGHPNHGTSATVRENHAASQYSAWTSQDSNGDVVIELYALNIQGSFTPPNAVANPTMWWEGALFMLLAHESYHACMSPWTTYGSDCYNEDSSCEHLAVETSAASDACDNIKEIIEDIGNATTTAEEDDLNDKLDGACSSYNGAQDKWNTSEGRAVANFCLCSPINTCSFIPSSSCSASLPSPPAGKDCSNSGGEPFGPNDDIIPDCVDASGQSYCSDSGGGPLEGEDDTILACADNNEDGYCA